MHETQPRHQHHRITQVGVCAQAGASRIFAIDINPSKFETAKEFGATDCLNPKVCACIYKLRTGWLHSSAICSRFITVSLQ